MFGITRISLFALLLTPAALADSHSRSKRRSHAGSIAKRDAPLPEVEFSGNGTEHSLSKRAFNGRGTFYYTGLGACGQYSKDSDYMVALNSAQYGGGYPGPQCFKMITVQANGVTVGGVQILDECPTCDYGGLDLSPSLFRRFADEGAGVISLTWWFDGDGPAPAPAPAPPTSEWHAPSPTWSPEPAPTPTSTWTPPPPPPTSTSTWVAPTSTSTYVAPSPSTTITSTSDAPSSSSSSSSSSFSSVASSIIASSSVGVNSTNPFAVVSNTNVTSSSIDPAASAAPSGTTETATDGSTIIDQAERGNLAAINGLVAQYGQLIVVGAGGYQ